MKPSERIRHAALEKAKLWSESHGAPPAVPESWFIAEKIEEISKILDELEELLRQR